MSWIGLGAGIFVDFKHDQAKRHLERCGKGHAALLAFLNIVFRVFELERDEFKRATLREVFNRENRLEDFLQASVGPFFDRHLALKKLFIRRALNLD